VSELVGTLSELLTCAADSNTGVDRSRGAVRVAAAVLGVLSCLLQHRSAPVVTPLFSALWSTGAMLRLSVLVSRSYAKTQQHAQESGFAALGAGMATRVWEVLAQLGRVVPWALRRDSDGDRDGDRAAGPSDALVMWACAVVALRGTETHVPLQLACVGFLKHTLQCTSSEQVVQLLQACPRDVRVHCLQQMGGTHTSSSSSHSHASSSSSSAPSSASSSSSSALQPSSSSLSFHKQQAAADPTLCVLVRVLVRRVTLLTDHATAHARHALAPSRYMRECVSLVRALLGLLGTLLPHAQAHGLSALLPREKHALMLVLMQISEDRLPGCVTLQV
jgi:hypothetical protein